MWGIGGKNSKARSKGVDGGKSRPAPIVKILYPRRWAKDIDEGINRRRNSWGGRVNTNVYRGVIFPRKVGKKLRAKDGRSFVSLGGRAVKMAEGFSLFTRPTKETQ